jgi:hypothetical protein
VPSVILTEGNRSEGRCLHHGSQLLINHGLAVTGGNSGIAVQHNTG